MKGLTCPIVAAGLLCGKPPVIRALKRMGLVGESGNVPRFCKMTGGSAEETKDSAAPVKRVPDREENVLFKDLPALLEVLCGSSVAGW